MCGLVSEFEMEIQHFKLSYRCVFLITKINDNTMSHVRFFTEFGPTFTLKTCKLLHSFYVTENFILHNFTDIEIQLRFVSSVRMAYRQIDFK